MKINDYTYEDSSIITESLSNDMMSEIIMEKTVSLGPNTNIDYMAKKGQKIKAGQMLMSFEESYDEKEANMLLSKIGDEFKEEITALGKNIVKSKYTGVVEDIEILYTRPIEEFSPSLQKVIKEYNKETLKKEAILKKHVGTDHNIQLRPTTHVETEDGKIKGRDVGDGVIINMYIKYEDKMGVGDKLTFYTAVKSVIQQVVPDEQAPYSEYRPEEPIQAVMAPVSYFNRMVGSVMINLYGNKVMVELKRKVGDIYGIDVVKPK